MTARKCPQCGNAIPLDLAFEPNMLPHADQVVSDKYVDERIRHLKFCSTDCLVNAFRYGPNTFNELEKFLYALRQANPVITMALFLNVQCGQLFNIVKCAFPDAEAHTDDCKPQAAHTYIKWKGDYYDITGKIDPEKLTGISINKTDSSPIFVPWDDRYIWHPGANLPESDWISKMKDPDCYRKQYESAKKEQK